MKAVAIDENLISDLDHGAHRAGSEPSTRQMAESHLPEEQSHRRRDMSDLVRKHSMVQKFATYFSSSIFWRP